MTGAQAIVKALEMEGVELVFGYPGAAICPVYDALRGSRVRHVLVRQEQNAGHAASGYARISGRPGVCIATSGPGATNLMTALAGAYMDSIPLVAITGQVATSLLGRDVFQEVDTTGAAEPFVKHSYLAARASDLPRILKEAFCIAATGRPGPVLIDVPVDVQEEELDFCYPDRVDIPGYRPTVKGHAGQIRRACQLLAESARPLICAGGGVLTAGAGEVLRAFAGEAGIPIVSTMMGIGAVAPSHPNYMGMIGSHGVRSANMALRRADLLLLVGARVGDRAIDRQSYEGGGVGIIHIDIDPAEIGKNVGTDVPIVGDAKTVLEQLREAYAPVPAHRSWLMLMQQYRDRGEEPSAAGAGGIAPQRFFAGLWKLLPEDTILAADVGQNQIWAAAGYRGERGAFLTSGGLGVMGYSLPAAIGAKLAAPGRVVCATCGDGSFPMMMMELGTLMQEGLDIKLVLFQNGLLGMIRELQDRHFGGRHIAIDLSGGPDFVALAAAYGIPGLCVETQAEAEEGIRRMMETPGPFLLVCKVSPQEDSHGQAVL